jgi:serine/threonine protein kinase
VLHRDIKPSNVLVDGAGRVLLTDFGVAHLEGVRLTRTGTVVGSPAYMAPEQLAGKSARELTPACDLYSLATVLYELAEGKDPFRLGRQMDVFELLRKKREDAPLPMRQPGTDALEPMLRECLAFLPSERPSVDAAAAAFRAVAEQLGERGDGLVALVRDASEAVGAQLHPPVPADERSTRRKQPVDVPVAESEAHSGSLVWGLMALALLAVIGWVVIRHLGGSTP